MVSSLSQDRFSRHEGKSSQAKVFMEDCGHTTVAGSAELLRRFFSKVYTKLTVEGRDEPKGRPPRRATHSGIVCEFSNTDNNDYSMVTDAVTVCKATVATKTVSGDTNDIHQADASAYLDPKGGSPVTSPGTQLQDWTNEGREVPKEEGGGPILAMPTSSIPRDCRPSSQTLSAQNHEAPTGRIQYPERAAPASLRMAEPPDKAPVVNAVQFQPEGGAVRGAMELFGLNFAQVEHPSPGAPTKDDVCSMDVPVETRGLVSTKSGVKKLYDHSTSSRILSRPLHDDVNIQLTDEFAVE